MLFYIFLSYVLGPAAFYYFRGKTLTEAGHGFVAGSVVSVVLWLVFGSKMVK
jgi:hypothetical protein